MIAETPTIKKRDDSENIPFVYEDSVPTIMADGFKGVALINNSVRINLFEERFDPIEDRLYRQITTRLVIPISALSSFVDVLTNIKNQFSSLNLMSDKDDKSE